MLSGSGTRGNVVKGNYIHCSPTASDPQCYIGVLVSNGASGNVIGGDVNNWNVIMGHKFEGIAIIGQFTDQNEISYNKVGAFDPSGIYTGNRNEGNGAGIAILSEAAPEIHFPFPVYATSSLSDHPGPDGTIVHHNYVAGNRGNGIILIRATNFVAYENEVMENSGNGIYWIGSTGEAYRNNLAHNDLSGVRIEPYFGHDTPGHPATSPSTHDDDVVSEPTDANRYGLYWNSIADNGEYGLLIIDNPWLRLNLISDPSAAGNEISGNSKGNAAKYWFGYVELKDPHSNPVLGKVVEIFRNDGDSVADYTSSTYDSNGRYGPTGFNYDDITTWFLILEEELSTAGIYSNYNAHRFRVSGSMLTSETYSWDGIYDPASESGGALESPPGSGAYRYQYAEVTFRSISVSKPKPKSLCDFTAQLNATDLNGYPVEPGDMLRYELRIRSDCDNAEAEAELSIPAELEIVPETLRSNVGSVSYSENWRVVKWTGYLQEREPVNISFDGKVLKTALGSSIETRALVKCLSNTCVHASVWSDDPLTTFEYDPTIRAVTSMRFEVPPAGSISFPFNLTYYGPSKVSHDCEGWKVKLEHRELEEGELKPYFGLLTVEAPDKALAGSSCEVKFEPSRVFPSMRKLNISSLNVTITVIPVLKVEAELDAYPRNLSLGAATRVLVRVRNEGNADLDVSLELPLKGFRLISIPYSTGGEISHDGSIKWALRVSPWSSRVAQVNLITTEEGYLSLQGILKIRYANESYEVFTDDPRTLEKGDQTVLIVTRAIVRGTQEGSGNRSSTNPQNRKTENNEMSPSAIGYSLASTTSIAECSGVAVTSATEANLSKKEVKLLNDRGSNSLARAFLLMLISAILVSALLLRRMRS